MPARYSDQRLQQEALVKLTTVAVCEAMMRDLGVTHGDWARARTWLLSSEQLWKKCQLTAAKALEVESIELAMGYKPDLRFTMSDLKYNVASVRVQVPGGKRPREPEWGELAGKVSGFPRSISMAVEAAEFGTSTHAAVKSTAVAEAVPAPEAKCTALRHAAAPYPVETAAKEQARPPNAEHVVRPPPPWRVLQKNTTSRVVSNGASKLAPMDTEVKASTENFVEGQAAEQCVPWECTVQRLHFLEGGFRTCSTTRAVKEPFMNGRGLQSARLSGVAICESCRKWLLNNHHIAY